MTRTLSFLTLALCLILAGCLPRRVAWSPDGSRALVWAADGLHLMDPDGKLGPLAVKDAGPMAWLPDGKHIVVARAEPARTWNEIAADMPQEEWNEVTNNAAILREEALKYTGGDWDKFGEMIQEKIKWPLTEYGILKSMMYLRDKNSEGLKEKLGVRWNEGDKLEVPLNVVRLYEVAGQSLKEGPVLARRGHGILEMRPSPTGRAVLIAESQPQPPEGKQTLARIVVVDAVGKAPPQSLAERCARYADWSHDGRSVVYARWTSGDLESNDLSVGLLGRRAVAEADGGLLAEPVEEERIAYIAFEQFNHVRVLPDGRILFSSLSAGLPSVADKGKRVIFVFDPANPREIRQVLKPTDEAPIDPICLDVSPDGKHVAMTEVKGRMGILDIAAGTYKIIQPETQADAEGASPSLVAVWRNNDEVSYVVPVVPAPAADAGVPVAQVVLTKSDGSDKRVLSTTWSKEAQLGFLTPKPKSEPAK